MLGGRNNTSTAGTVRSSTAQPSDAVLAAIIRPFSHDRVPLHRLKAAKEITEKQRPTIAHLAAKRQPIAIDAKQVDDLNRNLTRNLAAEKEAAEQKHREHLHHLSTTRVKTWNNTIASQSRQRKQEREAVLAAEEAARVKVDVAHARDEAARRDAMIQRAKALLLYENDHVKNVHVQFVMDQVLMERDLQIQYKQRHAEAVKQRDADWLRDRLDLWAPRVARDEAACVAAHNARLATAAEQRKQHESKLAEAAAERQRNKEDGERVRRIDSEYNAKSAEIAVQKLEEQKQNMAVLDQMKEQHKMDMEQAARTEREQDAKIQQWFEQKEQLENTRKAAEQAALGAQLQIRQKIGAKQYAALESERNKKNAWVDMRMKQKQKEEQKKESALEQKKQDAADEMQRFFTAMQLSKQEALRAKQESNQRATEENLRTREAIHAESLAKRALIRAKSLAIEDSHRRQIERSEAQRAEERRQVMEAKAQAMRDDGKEEAMVREYIAEVLAEPWMKGNPRAKSVDAYHKKAFAQSMEMASAVTKSAVTKGKKAQQKSKA